jgi:hypothetical protein
VQPSRQLRGARRTRHRPELPLRPSWTKGGRARIIPIRTAIQREVLGRAHRLAGRGSLIPSAPNYRHQLQHLYDQTLARIGLIVLSERPLSLVPRLP